MRVSRKATLRVRIWGLILLPSVRTGLAEASIDFGVFGPAYKADNSPKRQSCVSTVNGDTSGHGHESSIAEVLEEAEDEADEDEEEDERLTRPVIKLRLKRRGRNPSRSRSRRDLSEAAAEGIRRPISPDANDSESVANVRFSAHIVAKTDLSALMPFALIAPEPNKRRQRPEFTSVRASPENDHNLDGVPNTPSSQSTRNYPFLQSRPDDLKGVFIRKFRWGTVDVLNPNHCDFSALRTAVFSTHLKVSTRPYTVLITF